MGFAVILAAHATQLILAKGDYEVFVRLLLQGERHGHELGWLAVELFFILSSYLITGILWEARQKKGALAGYARHRALRIVPAYAVLLAICFTLGNAGATTSLWPSALLAQNFWPGTYRTAALVPSWSLAVEAQFYLLWPLVLLAPHGLGERAWTRVLAASLVVWPLAKAVFAWGYGLRGLYFFTPYHCDVFAWGALLYFARANGALKRPAWRRASAVLAWVLLPLTLVWMATTDPYGPVLGTQAPWRDVLLYSLSAAGLAGLLARVLLLKPEAALRRCLCLPSLRFLGRISYGGYLFHMAAWVPWTLWVFSSPSLEAWSDANRIRLAFFGMAALVLAAGSLSWYAIERPFLRWRAR